MNKNIAAALDRMDALIAPGNSLLAVSDTSATAEGARADMARIRGALEAAQPLARLDSLALMKAVMQADEALVGRCIRGTTNWAAAIGKAVRDAALAATQPATLPNISTYEGAKALAAHCSVSFSGAQAAPVLTSAAGGDWTKPTTVAQRLADAVQLLCGGKRPPDDMVQGWLNAELDDTRLQSFCADHGPAWAQGIGLIDAAMVLVDQPTEITTIDSPDRDHEHRATAAQPAPAANYDHGPQSTTVEEAARHVGKWLNERPNRPLDLRDVAMLVAHAQAPAAGAVAGPVNRIPLLDENDPGCALVRTTRGWDFRRNGNLIRHLNLYERLFVESALAAAPTPAAQPCAKKPS